MLRATLLDASAGNPAVVHIDRRLRSSAVRFSRCPTLFAGIHWVYIKPETIMATPTDSLLLKFRAKDTRFGVTRDTVRALASELDISETQVVHMALSRFAEELLPAYEPDDGPLTSRQLAAVRKAAAAMLPKGKVLSSSSLF
jgi:hypothetical protein